nr:prolyl oligopeptidase family serine peptidase [uncultured Intestinibacter sp.]
MDWNENVGIKYTDLDYKNENGNKYDLYIPKNLDKEKKQYLILFIHGGSFNSGSKEDGDIWCKYYASKGYITATVDYTLQNQGKEASIFLMNEEIENAIEAIKVKTSELGYNVVAMASSGVSAGGTLAMNLAYNSNSVIPVKFVFQLAAPTYFEPNDWELLMKVNRWNSNEEFLKMMTGFDLNEKNYMEQVKKISPSCLVNKNTVPTLFGYGLRDHCVPLNQKSYLIDSLDKYEISYDYIEFPKSNHGMYNDLDKMQEFIDMSLEYCKRYFN